MGQRVGEKEEWRVGDKIEIESDWSMLMRGQREKTELYFHLQQSITNQCMIRTTIALLLLIILCIVHVITHFPFTYTSAPI